MPLHGSKHIKQRNPYLQESPNDDLHSSVHLQRKISKSTIPKELSDSRSILELIRGELLMDKNVRLNMADFTQTWEEPEVIQIMNETMNYNLVDRDEYPHMSEIENRCISMIGHLWNAPDLKHMLGCSTTGSSEACMLAGLALKFRWRKQRKAQGKPIDKPNLICGPAQVCWHKFGVYFDVEIRQVKIQAPNYILTPETAIKLCDENTIGVMVTWGNTMVLEYEPVEDVSKALDEYQKKTGLDIPIHVDAASGGFISPFIQQDLVWDFKVPRVVSINASGHKYGLAPLGIGWIVWRTPSDLPEELVFHVNYLGGDMPTFSLTFSRPASSVVAQYYTFLKLGMQGYAHINHTCVEVGKYLAHELKKIDVFKIIYGGENGIPGVCWAIKEGANTYGASLFDISDRLRTEGWMVPAYTLVPDCDKIIVMRVVVRHAVTLDQMHALVACLKLTLEHFRTHPIVKGLEAHEAYTFHH